MSLLATVLSARFFHLVPRVAPAEVPTRSREVAEAMRERARELRMAGDLQAAEQYLDEALALLEE